MAGPPTLLLTALRAEAVCLRRALGTGWRPESLDGTAAWRWESRNVCLAVTGMGGARAAAGAAALMERWRPQRLLVVGVAGGLDPHLRPEAVVVPTLVLEEATGDRLVPTLDGAERGVLLSARRPLGSVAAKAAARDRFGADAVDLETAAVGRIAAERGVAWLGLRAISDAAEETLPPFLGDLVDPEGRSRPWSVLAALARDPARIRTLRRLGGRTRRGMSAVAQRLERLL